MIERKFKEILPEAVLTISDFILRYIKGETEDTETFGFFLVRKNKKDGGDKYYLIYEMDTNNDEITIIIKKKEKKNKKFTIINERTMNIKIDILPFLYLPGKNIGVIGNEKNKVFKEVLSMKLKDKNKIIKEISEQISIYTLSAMKGLTSNILGEMTKEKIAKIKELIS